MRKRIALAVAIATAISVGGMVPASATKLTAPVVGDSNCIRSGSTLIVNADDADITVERTSSSALTITYDSVTLTSASSCSTSTTTLTSVVLSADDDSTAGEGNVTFDLESYTAGYLAAFSGIAFTVQAEGTLKFDGFDLTEAGAEFRPITATVGEESFVVGTLSGSYYAGELEFAGGDAGDTFDASGVTTTPVMANGYDGDDTLKGGADDDELTGGNGDDVLFANGGDDELFVKDGGVCVSNAKRSIKAQGCGEVSAGGIDQAWGGAGSDTFEADSADTVAPGDGIDFFDSTTAVAQLNYSDSSTAVVINLTTAPGIVKTAAGDDYFAGVAVDEFVGSAFADTMVGSTDIAHPENNGEAFYGGAGADTILGLGGPDFLAGGGGADVIKGGAYSDEIYGDSGADKINAGSGNDVVDAGGGDDIVYGSAGDDSIFGGKGSDQAWGGKGTFDVCAAEITDKCEFKK